MKFSVITINYNEGEGLLRTIQSVVGQTATDFEYIIIDGGSTDQSVDHIRHYASRIAYWVSEPDGGIYPAMNKGVAQAHGDYCIFMNAGDSFHHPRVLEEVSALLDADILVGKVYTDKGKEMLYQPSEVSMYFLYASTFPHQGTFMRTKLLRRHPYDESLRIASDWKFFLQTVIFENCSVRFLPVVVAVFDSNGISSTQSEASRAEREAVLRSMLPERILLTLRRQKESECLTQTLTPQLRRHYTVDRILYRLGSWLLHLTGSKSDKISTQ
jgi:glycosyltransferase involved in cell wall biosynthesis